MATNKIVLRETDEVMADYKPSYTPFWPVLLGNSKSYPEVVGKVNFKRLEAVGAIRAQHYNPKDTHIHQIAAVEKSKTYKKYFFAAQFVQSTLQDREQNEDVIKQILDENNKLQDDLVLLGEGTAADSTIVNNGLYWSLDPNYLLENSSALASTDNHLPALHASVVAEKIKADTVSGRKVVVFYGSTMLTKLSGVYGTSSIPFRDVLIKAIGGNYSIAELPSEVTPSGANGFMILTLDQIKLHYTAVPKLDDQGVDARNKEVWHNFLLGSTMVEVLAYKGVIRQPHTFA